MLFLFLSAVALLAPAFGQNAVIRGKYGAVFTGVGGGVPIVALGWINFDANGQVVEGRTIWNVIDGRFDKRKTVEHLITGGSYVKGENGRGTAFIEGLPITNWQLLVGEVETQRDGAVLAKTLDLVGDTVDPYGGNLFTVSLFRRPDNAVYGVGVIKGKYVREFTGHGGFSQLAAFGKVDIDGAGAITSVGNSIVNLPGETLGSRVTTGLPAAGTLAMGEDGIGFLSVQEGQPGVDGGDVLAFKSKLDSNGDLVAVEAFLLFSEMFDLGNISTGRVILQFVPE